MKKSLVLKAQIREQAGTKLSNKLRKDGRIPAIIYGHKKASVSVSLDEHNLLAGLLLGTRVLEINIEGKKETVMIKELQYDYLGKDVIHADLMRVNVTEKVRVSVPISLKGVAEGTKDGGIIEEHSPVLEVECQVNAIPDVLIVDIKGVKVGDNLFAKDVVLPEGVVLMSDPATLVLTCSVVTEVESAEELEEGMPSAPEVIGEKKEEDSQE